MSYNQPPPVQPPFPGPLQPLPPTKPKWARKRVMIPAGLLVFFFGVGVGTSGDTQEKTGSAGRAAPRPTVTVTETAPTQPARTGSPVKDDKPAGSDGKDGDEKDETAKVPDFVGMGLQSAQDKAQETGFYHLTSHDTLGRDRMQAFDRNWKVCSQNVRAGASRPTDTKLDFGAAKLEETCPAKDRKPPAVKDGRMPDFSGKSVKSARAALDSGTSITVKDALPDDRWVVMESNWKVCTQKPAAGTSVNGRPVTFTAVKFEEQCP